MTIKFFQSRHLLMLSINGGEPFEFTKEEAKLFDFVTFLARYDAVCENPELVAKILFVFLLPPDAVAPCCNAYGFAYEYQPLG